ncbi:MAG TPA: YncE family protein [Bryobacteraceae bacterium]|jgi:DNA-binding beta-propeller fold protein YncE|nr:YncE family protein [Bryobacteraceae bacterium]
MSKLCAALVLLISLAGAQQVARRDKPLVFTEAIPLEAAKGRFDHFALGRGVLFVSALGSNAVEAINIGGRVLEHTIANLPDPQGVAFAPESNKVFVASGRGKVYVYDGKSYDPITAIDFEGGADNMRYDAATKRVYLGCGDDEKTGAIAMIDSATNHRLDEEYKLGGEPESFQLEQSGPNIYVNVPDLKQVVVVNRATKQVAHWPLKGVASNFPMALDEADHRLFVGVHSPPRLAVLDTNSGRLVALLPSVQDSDDLYFDAARKRVYMPGGEGFIDVFQMTDPDHYTLLARIPTAIGARTAGYFGKQGKGFDRFYLAVPARGGQPAEVRIYTVQD